MARNGSGVYSLPAGSTVANGDTSDATDLNTPLADLEADANTPRPIVAGGTGAMSDAGARTNLGLAIGSNVQAYSINLDGFSSIDPDTLAVRYIDSVTITTSTISAAKDIPADYTGIFIEFEEFEPATTDSGLVMRLGTAGAGGSFLGTSAYVDVRTLNSNGTLSGAVASDSYFPLTGQIGSGVATKRGFGEAWFRGLNTTGGIVKGKVSSGGVTESGANQSLERRVRCTTTGNYNAVQFLTSSGNIGNLTLHIYGLKNA